MTVRPGATCLAAGLFAVLAGIMPAAASPDVIAMSRCDYWRAGAEAPIDRRIRIEGIIYLNRGSSYAGSTLEGGEYVTGTIHFDVKPDSPPLFPIALIDNDFRSSSFLIPANETAFLRDSDDREILIMSGKLSAHLIADSFRGGPIDCVRRPGSPVLRDYRRPTLRERFAGPSGGVDGRDGPRDRDEGLAGIFAGNEEPTEEEKPGRSPSITSIITRDKEKPDKKEGGLAGVLTGVKSGDEQEKTAETKPARPTGTEPAGSVDIGPVETERAPRAIKVCHFDDTAPELTLNGDIPDGPAFAVGLVKPDRKLTAYWYDTFAGALQAYGFESRLSLPASTLARIAIPGDRTYMVDEKSVFPIRLADLSDMVVNVGNPEPEAPPADPLNFAVFGDRASVALSGLDRLEKELEKKGIVRNWTIAWYEVKADGSLSERVDAGSFNELVGMAGDDSEPAFLTDPDAFGRFVDAMENTIVSSAVPLDQVFWIMEGYIVPNSAPPRLESFFRRINKEGKISRGEDGSPNKWLQIITGYFAQDFSKAYISGPLATTRPEAGYISVEDRKGDRTVLLTSTVYPMSAIEIALRRKAATPEPSAMDSDYDPDALAYDSREVFDGIGIVIEKDLANRINKSVPAIRLAAGSIADGTDYTALLQRDTLDLTALLDIRTDDDGSVKGLELNPVTFERRIKLFLKENGPEDFQNAIDRMARSLLLIDNQYGETDCSHYFLPDKTLGSTWEKQ